MRKIRIAKAVSVFPKNSYTNDEFIAKYKVDTTSEWIETMTGIKRRFFVEDADEFSQLIIDAAKKIQQFHEFDAIIVASSTNFYKFPGLSQIVHEALELPKSIYTLDLNAACDGFMQGLFVANMLIDSEQYKNVLVIGADAMSSVLDMSDRSTCCLFGDGVGAVLVQASENNDTTAIWEHITHSNFSALHAKTSVIMNGRCVFENSIKVFEEIINTVAQKSALALADIDLFVLHQANYRIFKKLSERMGLDDVKVPFLAGDFANTSAATIPIALSKLNFENKKLILAGFGAGFAASATLIS